jgi:hypothetical protein
MRIGQRRSSTELAILTMSSIDDLPQRQKVVNAEPQVGVLARAQMCCGFPRFPHALDCTSEGEATR